jgi:DNA-binding NtrC family response regulator
MMRTAELGRPGELATLKRTGFSRPRPTGATFVLTVVEGPDAGMVVTLDASGPTRALLGQSPVCTLRLSDAQVSRRHAALMVHDSNLEIRDLGSTNGTTINGVLVREAYLTGGEAIRVGGTVLRVEREAGRFAPLAQASSFGGVIGESRAMRKLFTVLASLATNDHAVLIEGDSGTGKQLVASEIHRASRRKDGPFVVLEASSLPTDEIGSRLFGDDGLLAQARSGVLFIDEIGDLPRGMQVLLRERQGSADVRLIAATKRDLDRDVANGRFDEGLFFALAGGRVDLPPLREREGDVAALARHFWRELGETDLPEDFLPRFEHYPWPGNVRELKSAVLARKTTGVLGSTYRSDEAKASGLDFLASVIEEDLPFPAARERVVMEFERRYVDRVLARHGGNVTRAARASGVAHRYFQLIRARLR